MGTVGTASTAINQRDTMRSIVPARWIPHCGSCGREARSRNGRRARLYFRFLCFDQRRIDVLVCTSVCWYTVPAVLTRETITRIRTWYTVADRGELPAGNVGTFGAPRYACSLNSDSICIREASPFPIRAAQLDLHSFRSSVPLVADCECKRQRHCRIPIEILIGNRLTF